MTTPELPPISTRAPGSAEDRLAKVWTDPQRPVFDVSSGISDSPRWAILACPACPRDDPWGNALHMRLGQMVVWPDLDDYDSPAHLRGEFVIIPMDCECGARFGLQITNHKGSQMLTMLTYRGRWRGELELDRRQKATS